MSLQRELEASQQRLRDLREEEKQIREASTAFRLEKNAREQREEVGRSHELQKRVNQAIAAEGPTPREVELTEQIKESIHNEQSLMRRVGQVIPEKFIRPDALVHFRADRDKAQNRIDHIRSQADAKGVILGDRYKQEIFECEEVVRAYDKNKPVYEMAERIYRERMDRKSLEEERNKIEAERRERIAAL